MLAGSGHGSSIGSSDGLGSWGAGSVILSVTETNAGAAAFYERLGFVDTGDRHRLREGSDLTVRVMSRAP